MKRDKFEIFFYVFILALVILLVVSARGQEAEISMSGGQFSITKTVVAGGGNKTQDNSTVLNSTAGQTVAGKQSTGGSFNLYTGFWTPDSFAPTAANAVVSGRVKTAADRGISNVSVTITFPGGEIRMARSNAFGYYTFTDIPVGEIYIIRVSSNRYTFNNPVQIREIIDDLQNLDFIAEQLM